MKAIARSYHWWEGVDKDIEISSEVMSGVWALEWNKDWTGMEWNDTE